MNFNQRVEFLAENSKFQGIIMHYNAIKSDFDWLFPRFDYNLSGKFATTEAATVAPLPGPKGLGQWYLGGRGSGITYFAPRGTHTPESRGCWPSKSLYRRDILFIDSIGLDPAFGLSMAIVVFLRSIARPSFQQWAGVYSLVPLYNPRKLYSTKDNGAREIKPGKEGKMESCMGICS